jgi:hypothetical protein
MGVNDLSDDKILSVGDVACYVSKAKEGKPDIEGSKALLRLFCERAKKLKFPDSPFPEPLLELLISAFENYLSGDEKDLEKSLGLKRRVGKPPSPEVEKRNINIAHEVLCKDIDGINLTINKISDGAFLEIAELHNLSDSEVRDIYYKHLNDAISLELLKRLSN